MADARAELEWTQTAEVLAMIANVNRDTKRKPTPYRSEQFNPYAKGHRRSGGGIPITAENIGLLKQAFIKQEGAKP